MIRCSYSTSSTGSRVLTGLSPVVRLSSGENTNIGNQFTKYYFKITLMGKRSEKVEKSDKSSKYTRIYTDTKRQRLTNSEVH